MTKTDVFLCGISFSLNILLYWKGEFHNEVEYILNLVLSENNRIVLLKNQNRLIFSLII